MLLVKGVMRALEQVGREERLVNVAIDERDFVDTKAPKKFSYLDAATIARGAGNETVEEIAKSIIAQRNAQRKAERKTRKKSSE